MRPLEVAPGVEIRAEPHKGDRFMVVYVGGVRFFDYCVTGYMDDDPSEAVRLAAMLSAVGAAFAGAPSVRWRDVVGAPEGNYLAGEPQTPVNVHLGPKYWEIYNGETEDEWERWEPCPGAVVFGPLPGFSAPSERAGPDDTAARHR